MKVADLAPANHDTLLCEVLVGYFKQGIHNFEKTLKDRHCQQFKSFAGYEYDRKVAFIFVPPAL